MSARIWRATIVGGLAVASVAGAGTAAVAQGRTTAATNGPIRSPKRPRRSTSCSPRRGLGRRGRSRGAARRRPGDEGQRATSACSPWRARTAGSSPPCAPTRRWTAWPATGRSARRPPTARMPRRGHREADRRGTGRPRSPPPGGSGPGGRRAAGRHAVGHADDRRHPGRLLRRQPGRRRACSSASSTPASTARTPTSRRTSTRALSRNFTTDIPLIDGACARRARPVLRATRPTSTRAATAPTSPARWRPPQRRRHRRRGARRAAGEPAGRPGLRLLLPAAHRRRAHLRRPHGIDVVNMSFFTDPWLYNCADNPADSPEEQAEQRTIIEATQRARAASPAPRRHAGRGAGQRAHRPRQPDDRRISPDFPPGTRERPATVDNTCLDVPTEADGVISVSALGPSGEKADYSNYGTEQTDFSAPGGYFRDFFGTPQFRSTENLVLSSVAARRGHRRGQRRPDHGSAARSPFVVAELHGRHRRHLHLLAVAAGHVDGVTARGRRGRPGGQRPRQAGQGPRRPDAGAGQGRDSHAARPPPRRPCPAAAPRRLHSTRAGTPSSTRSAWATPTRTASTAAASSTPSAP